MAVSPQPAFTPDASVGFAAGPTSSNVALPGTPADDTVVRIANMGGAHAAVALGTDDTVVASGIGASLVVLAGSVMYLAIGTGKYLAAIALSGPTAVLNITTGN